jgi:hypothetical protein
MDLDGSWWVASAKLTYAPGPLGQIPITGCPDNWASFIQPVVEAVNAELLSRPGWPAGTKLLLPLERRSQNRPAHQRRQREFIARAFSTRRLSSAVGCTTGRSVARDMKVPRLVNNVQQKKHFSIYRRLRILWRQYGL